jgi:hypothetical protein
LGVLKQIPGKWYDLIRGGVQNDIHGSREALFITKEPCNRNNNRSPRWSGLESDASDGGQPGAGVFVGGTV